MTRSKLFGPIVLLGVIILSAGCQKEPSAAAESVIREFHQAFDHKDMAALKALCHEEMFWYTLNGKALPPGAFDQFFMPMLRSWGDVKTVLTDVQFQGDGSLMTARYKSTIHIISHGRTTPLNNLHTMILIKTGGAWKIWQHHMSKE